MSGKRSLHGESSGLSKSTPDQENVVAVTREARPPSVGITSIARILVDSFIEKPRR
jgi:hypothetical protein